MTATTGSPTDGSPEVLVIIVNFNAGALLSDAVEGMRRQTFTNYRLLVVDNASTDDSISLMLERFPEVEVLHAGSNIGFAAANNLAVKSMPGSHWLALLNPDAVPEPDWLRRLVEAGRHRTDVGSLASRTLDAADPRVLDGAGDAYHVSGRYWRRGHGAVASVCHAKSEEIFSACAAAALYSRAAWEQVGGMDESFFCYGEDVDLGFRLQLAGYGCLYLAEAIALHHGSAVTGRRSDFSIYHGQRNIVWVFVKNMPATLFWMLLPYHLLLNVVALLDFALHGRGRVAARAKLDALRGVARAWEKRAQVKRLRQISTGRLWRAFARGRPWPRC
ncbi:MAG TPA: glycosyltransferase family 2 protein [Burkholderiales bacterium]|nr:glycosyltransferase family 2 protein [Burkholderiales bacterium]